MTEILTPWEKYQQDLRLPGFHPDPVQERAVMHTQRLFEQIVGESEKSRPGLWQRFLPGRRPGRIKGLYFWGGVGRGKTHVVDSFFSCLPFAEKQRRHFHAFMHEVHEQLKLLPKTPDPLPLIADDLARRWRLLILDEFHVYDVADAMLLVGLLPALYDRGISLVMTSNIGVDQLYRNGLQRERFQQVIDFIKARQEVIEFAGDRDYRAELIVHEGVCHIASSQSYYAVLEYEFNKLTMGMSNAMATIKVSDRDLQVYGCSSDVLWVDFQELCVSARSSIDYIELARRFRTVVTGLIPVMSRYQDDAARRFVHLIDVLYDHNIKLIFAAEAEPENLYAGTRLQPSYQRTVSRLREMCSQDYLHRPRKGI